MLLHPDRANHQEDLVPQNGNRRIDRIRDPAYLEGLEALSLEDLRARRDECMAEREYLSLLRRLVQGRAEILKAELDARGGGKDAAPLIDRLSEILGGDETRAGASAGSTTSCGSSSPSPRPSSIGRGRSAWRTSPP